jgi:hypothetical protein
MSSEPDDLLGKADALMARHHPGRPAALRNPEIPVLEEVVDYPPGGGDLPVLTEYVMTAPPDEEQIEALAAGIRGGLLAELQPAIDALIEERLRECLAPLIEGVFDELRGKLQLTAREILDDALHTALERELRRRNNGE